MLCAEEDLTASPQTWRCFQRDGELAYDSCVGFTCVEVFQRQTDMFALFVRGLHICEGVSRGGFYPEIRNEYSPRVWGCFHRKVDGAFP